MKPGPPGGGGPFDRSAVGATSPTVQVPPAAWAVVVVSCLRSSFFLFLSGLLALATVVPGARAVERWDPIWERSVREDIGSIFVPPVAAVATDDHGNAYVTGFRANGSWGSPASSSSMTLAKYGPAGRPLWRRAWTPAPGHHRYAVGFDVAVAPDGRTVYVVGTQFNDSTEDGVPRIWAYGATGSLRWIHVAWGGGASAMGRAVAARRGGVVVGGFTFGECGPTNGMIAAWSRAGERRWQDPFEPAARPAFGDALYALAIDAQGGIYAVGSQDRSATSCDLTEPTPDVDVSIQRRSATGQVAWTHVWADGDAVDDDRALSAAARGDAIVVGGRRDGYPGRAWLARIERTGAVRWSRVFGPEPSAGARVTGLDVSPWGPVYAVGKVKGAMFLRRYALDGRLVSERRLAGLTASHVAAGLGGVLYVTGEATLWRMPT